MAPDGVVTIRAIVTAADLADPITKDSTAVPGESGSDTIDGIPVGENRTLTLEGLDTSGTAIWEGASTALTINAGQTTDAGTVVLSLMGGTAPVASDLNRTTDEDTPLAMTLVAFDAEGNEITFTIVDSPNNGAISGTPPDVTYTPEQDFHGSDSFTFKANDGTSDSNTALATITVNSVNDIPDLSGTPETAADTGTSYSFEPFSNDADGDTLIFSASSVPGWAELNTATGGISGIVSEDGADPIATYPGITICATDGIIASPTCLPPFTITVTDVTPPEDPVLTVTAGSGRNFLTWTDPAAADLVTVSIRRDMAGYPATEADGTLVGTFAPGVEAVTDGGLMNGTLYYYSAFGRDEVPLVSDGSGFCVCNDAATPKAATEFDLKLTASDAAADDQFGLSVAISGNTAIAGAWGQDSGGTSAGAAYVYVRDAGSGAWDAGTRLVAPVAQPFAFFGGDVTIDGDIAIVGADGEDSPGTDAGAVYVFVRDPDNGTWDAGTRLVAPDAQAGDRFGYSVAISGNSAIVGAPFEEGGAGDPAEDAGAAYVFVRDAGTGQWDAGTKLDWTTSVAKFSEFGFDVAIDGDLAVVGAPTFAVDFGAVFFFARDSGTGSWGTGDLLRPGIEFGVGEFGTSVAISGDTAIVGVPQGTKENGTTVFGAAAVVGRNPDDGSWSVLSRLERATFIVGFSNFFAQFSLYGNSVAFDGEMAIVGGRAENGTEDDSGAAYVFWRDPSSGAWSESSTLFASDPQFEDYFGRSVAIDGGVAIVGAWAEDGGPGDPLPAAGAAYIFD